MQSRHFWRSAECSLPLDRYWKVRSHTSDKKVPGGDAAKSASRIELQIVGISLEPRCLQAIGVRFSSHWNFSEATRRKPTSVGLAAAETLPRASEQRSANPQRRDGVNDDERSFARATRRNPDKTDAKRLVSVATDLSSFEIHTRSVAAGSKLVAGK